MSTGHPPIPADLVINAGWLVPMSSGADPGEPATITDGAVAIADGRIVGVGTRQEIAGRFDATSTLSLAEHVLLPGLVNAHGHAAMTLLRGSSEDTPLQAWLTEQIWPLEAKWVDESFVRDGVRLALAEMIHAGITCFADMYFFPEIIAAEARAAGIRSQVCIPVIEFANAWCANSEEGFHKGLALHDQYRNDPLIDVAFGPHGVYSVTDDDLAKILMYSEELDVNVHIHLHENAAELAQNQDKFGTSGIRHLHQRDLLGPRLQAVHVTQIEPQEIELLAEANVQVVHCPTSNAKLASGICPVTALLGSGINVALGTDGAASNNTLDMLGEARLASLLAKLDRADAAALPARVALGMATSGGARALGRGDQTGSLVEGLAADLIAVDMHDVRHHPLYDPVAQLIHTSSGSSVTHVWVNGRCLMEAGRLTTLDEAAVLNTAEAWRRRIRP
ncbi:MAG: TRZ/ATZ family hydrolase [Gammaproteobacteria bacterium]|jgi:5-methylthioadenosine/S-adenosylhomocysteine deaminase